MFKCEKPTTFVLSSFQFSTTQLSSYVITQISHSLQEFLFLLLSLTILCLSELAVTGEGQAAVRTEGGQTPTPSVKEMKACKVLSLGKIWVRLLPGKQSGALAV